MTDDITKAMEEVAGLVPTAEAGAVAVAEKSENKNKKGPKKKKRVVKQISQGRAYIQATYNNTIITLTDPNGNTIGWSSSGHMGFRGPKKATPYAASIIVKNVVDKCRDFGLRDVAVFVSGVGSGREAAVRALNANGLNILSIKDLTPIPHNGCRPRKARRI